MTKAEIIEAIEATIRPNGEKAITAESLANLLIEMANATPEGGGGGGGGALRVFLPETELSEQQIAENVTTYNALANGETSNVVAVMSTMEEGEGAIMGMPCMSNVMFVSGQVLVYLVAIMPSDTGIEAIGFFLSSDGNVVLATE